MVAKTITHAEQAMTRHLQALANEDLDGVVSHFASESVLQTPWGFYRGAEELREHEDKQIRVRTVAAIAQILGK